MASFTTVGNELILDIPESAGKATITVDISGTYNMTILFQRELSSPGSGAWETIEDYTVPNATVLANFFHPLFGSTPYRERYRLFLAVDNGGEATVDLTYTSIAVSATLLTQYDIAARLSAGEGAIESIGPDNLTEEASPEAGDWLLIWQAEGPLRKADASNLAASGTVTVSGTPLATNYARWVDANTLEARTAVQVLSDIAAAAAVHTHATSDVTSGTFADARIAASNVTQHEAALTILTSQLSGTVLTAQIADDNVTLAKLEHRTANTLFGANDTGVPVEITAGSNITISGTTISAATDALPVVDTTSIVEDPVDGTKEMRIDVGAVATGTIRVLTMPDQDIDLTPTTGSFLSSANDAVTDAKLRNSAALTVIGRSANSSGDPADIAAVAASGAVLRESGSALSFGTIASTGIADLAVVTAKLAAAAVTQSKLASASVGTAQIIDANVTTDKIAALAVTDAKIAAATLTVDKLAATAYASQAQAETGTETTLLMTPERVAQAISAQSSAGALATSNRTGEGSTIDLSFTTDNRKIVLIDQNVTVPTGWPAGEWARLRNTTAASKSFTVTGGTINGESSITIAANGTFEFWCEDNTGSAPECYGEGESTEDLVLAGTVDRNGQTFSGAATVSGDTTHSGDLSITGVISLGAGGSAKTRVQTEATGFSLEAADSGTVIVCTAGLTVTVPVVATLGDAFSCDIIADGGNVVLDGPGATNLTIDDGNSGVVLVANSKIYAFESTAYTVLT